jgi:hypothetical protein
VRLKIRLTLLPFDALLKAAEVLTRAEEVHPLGTWQSKPAGYHLDAAMRHIAAHLSDPVDPQFGLPHLAHASCRVLMALAQEMRGEK